MENRTKKYLLFYLLSFAFLFRFNFLFKKKDFWIDEAFSFFYSQKPISFIVGSNDVHTPLFYLIAKSWLLISHNILFIRTLNILIFFVFMFILYKFLIKFFDDKIALKTMLLFALSPAMIYYSIEFRNYMLFLLFVTANLYYFYSLISKRNKLNFFMFILFSLAMLFTHYFAVLVLLSEFAYLFIHKRNLFFNIFFKAFIIIALLFSVQLFVLYNLFNKMQGFWFHKLTLTSFLSTFSYIFTMNKNTIFSVLFLALIFLLFINLVFNKIKMTFFYYLIFFPLFLAVISYPLLHIYHHRFFLFISIPIFILFSIDFNKFNKLLYLAVVVLLILHLFVVFVPYNSEISSTIDYIKQNNLTNNTFIHFTPFSYLPFRFYLPNSNNILVTNLTEKQLFTAGGSVIDKSKIYHKIPIIKNKIFVDTKTHNQLILNNSNLVLSK